MLSSIGQRKVQNNAMKAHRKQQQPFLNNVLPAIVLQNRLPWSNIKGPSSHSRVCHVSLSPALAGLGRRVVGVVVLLRLLMSGDIEMNPGPVGECTCLMLDPSVFGN